MVVMRTELGETMFEGELGYEMVRVRGDGIVV